MNELSPRAVLLLTTIGVVGVIVADTPAAIVGLGAPALLAALATARGRRRFVRRLVVIAPLLALAMFLGWFGNAPSRDLLPPALRALSALAWSSCLSTALAPSQIRAALRAVGVPLALVELVGHTRRFAIQLAATAGEAWNAAALRAGLSSLHATAGTVGQVAGVIVVRAFDRAECVAIATALRGGQLADAGPLDAPRAGHGRGRAP